ncbi:MAG: hypothetical protein V4685_03490 [Bacteroidota bacterium]
MSLLQFKKYTLSFLTLLLFSCNNKKPLIPKDLSNEKERENTLLVFVGEKVEVRYIPEKDTSVLMLNGEYYAKYKVLQNVYGDFTEDTIEFTAFDHYGEPAFSNYKNVLLFVSKHEGKYYHKKYQFYDVYKTKDERWAGRYSVRDLGYDNRRNKYVSAQKIDFTEKAFVPLELVNKKEISCWFPEPYYKIENDRAIPVYGNYIEDLFRIKKEGTLAKLFRDVKSLELDVVDTEMAEVRNTSKNDEKEFDSFWSSLIGKPDNGNYKAFRNVFMDTVLLNDTAYSINSDKVSVFLSEKTRKSFRDSTNLNYVISTSIQDIKESPYFKKEGLKRNDAYLLFGVSTIVDTVNTFEIKVQASFVKTKGGFKLYSIKEEKKCICWQ